MVERTRMAETQLDIMANMEHSQHGRKIDEITLETILSEVNRSRILYAVSAIAQEKQVFPKATNKAVDITPPFEIEVENYSLLNKVLRITAYANRFIKNLKKTITPRGVPTANEVEMANKKKTLR